MSRERRFLARLALPGARALALDPQASQFGVFAGGDRRTRVLAKLSCDAVRALRSAGAIAQTGEADAAPIYALTDAGRARLTRLTAQDDAPFQAQHQDRERIETDGPERVCVNRAESALAWLARRKDAEGKPLLTTRQVAAGLRLRADYEMAALRGRITSDWTAPPTQKGRRGGGAGALEGPESAIAARARLMRACEALGADLERAARGVCVEDRTLESLETTARWPRRSGRIVLQIALTRLADYYGLA